jgi:hypothetical protein
MSIERRSITKTIESFSSFVITNPLPCRDLDGARRVTTSPPRFRSSFGRPGRRVELAHPLLHDFYGFILRLLHMRVHFDAGALQGLGSKAIIGVLGIFDQEDGCVGG